MSSTLSALSQLAKEVQWQLDEVGANRLTAKRKVGDVEKDAALDEVGCHLNLANAGLKKMATLIGATLDEEMVPGIASEELKDMIPIDPEKVDSSKVYYIHATTCGKLFRGKWTACQYSFSMRDPKLRIEKATFKEVQMFTNQGWKDLHVERKTFDYTEGEIVFY